MAKEITPISLKTGMTSVNCYLIKLDSGFILIDTGYTKCRATLEEKLESAGCKVGYLWLIILTHGDFDHIGNCKYLRDKFDSKIAMHNDDAGMAEKGDMFWNRKKGNFIMKSIAKLLFRLSPSDRFSPDIFLKDGDDLTQYGLEAKVLALPGHSTGSIGVLTADGDLFCGDFLENVRNPALGSLMDDPKAAQPSAAKLESLRIKNVYPGHGKPFLMQEFKSRHTQTEKINLQL
jgi:hydroxyacylglutathione hydrolase